MSVTSRAERWVSERPLVVLRTYGTWLRISVGLRDEACLAALRAALAEPGR